MKSGFGLNEDGASMMRIRFVKTALSGGALAFCLTLAACEKVEERKKNFEELSGQVQEQLTHDVLGEPTDQEILQAASLDDRALAGVMVQRAGVADVTLEEALRTESYFAVGSVIAKPREDMSAIITSDEVAAEVEEEFSAEADQAPLPEAIMSAPEPEPFIEGRSTPMEAREPSLKALRESARAMKPPVVKRLDDTMARKLPEMSDAPRLEKLRQIDGLSQEALKRMEKMPDTAGPRMRRMLDEDKAVVMRERTRERLEKLGLPGQVEARDGGSMVIQVNISPTKYPLEGSQDIRGIKEQRIRNRFAPAKLTTNDLACNSERAKALMKTDAELATRCVVETLEESGDYEYVEKDFIFSHQFERRPSNTPTATISNIKPNDPLWSLQWHFREFGKGNDKSEGGAGFADFWNRTHQTGSAAVTVAVVDTGLQMDHPDIKGSANLAPGFDMVSDPFMGNDGDGRDSDPSDPGDACDPSDPLSEDTFHGTHVAGTVGVAATNNASGVAGGAWNVTIVPVRALGRCGGQLSDINDAIRWAAGVVPARDDIGSEIWNANPADIINLSIGLFERCPASLQEAINDATASGAIVVAAAGNARIDTKYYAPGGCDNVVTVAAGDGRGQLAYYSNYGDAVDIMAPGGDMSRDDDNDGRPDGILSTKTSHNCYDPVTEEPVETCFYAYENGTSMAAPHVSAALALLKSQFPAASADQLKSRLLTATQPRSQLQCSGKCTQYPGSTPIPGEEGMCYRPCGGATLDLAKAPLE